MRLYYLLLTLAILSSSFVLQVRAQLYDPDYAETLILAGNKTDVSHTLTLEAPSLGSSLTLTLPSSNAAGVLTNNGLGTLSWVNLGSILTNPMTSPGDMIYGGLLGAPTRLAAPATANQILLSGASSAPTWSSATYPATTAIDQLLYSNAANTVTGLATANNGVLITSSGGVPSISSTLPAVVQGNITSLGTISSGTWNGTAIGVANGGTGVTTASANTVFAGPSSGSAAAPTFRTLNGADLAAASSSTGSVAVLGRNTSDFTTSSSSLVDATGYSLAMAAGEVWAFEFDLEVNGNGNGMNFAIKVPAGATIAASAMGIYSSLSNFKCDRLTASDGTTNASKPYGKTSYDGPVRITGVVDNTNGAAGNIQLRVESANSGNTITIYANSYGMAHRF